MLYKSLILPIFDYADITFQKLNQIDEITLQHLQNAACHAILKTDYTSHIVDMHAELNLSFLYQRRCQHICNAVHKLLNSIGPGDCIDRLVYVHEIHNIPTRSAQGLLLHTLQTNLKCCERDFFVVGPKVWNQHPLETRQIVSHEAFKLEVKEFTFA